MEELKPCPFCGGEAVARVVDKSEPRVFWEYQVGCRDKDCFCSVDMVANPGDYIITGVNGEIYPCKPDIFEKTYEKVDEYMTEYIVGTDGDQGNWLTGERIVRCKDCAYNDPENDDNWRHFENACFMFSDYEGTPACVEPNGFCAWGERKVVE